MNETAINVITGIVGALGGGGIAAAWLNYKLGKGTQKKDYFELITERLDKEIIRLNQELDKAHADAAIQDAIQSKKIEQLETLLKEKNAMILELEKDKMNYLGLIQVLETGAEYLPFPYWLKDNDGIMIYLNKAYEDNFLKPRGYSRSDYVGHTDSAVWGEKVEQVFRENDQKAIKSNDRTWLGKEAADTILKGWKFFKFSRIHEGQVIGVGGMALKENL